MPNAAAALESVSLPRFGFISHYRRVSINESGILECEASLLGVCLLSVLAVLDAARVPPAAPRLKQGKYISQASAHLAKLVDAGNADGFSLHNNSFSLGGGWLKKSQDGWVAIYSVNLKAGKKYRFLATGDDDAKDVDLRVLDANGSPGRHRRKHRR